jgi:hypothetical protein
LCSQHSNSDSYIQIIPQYNVFDAPIKQYEEARKKQSPHIRTDTRRLDASKQSIMFN